MNQPRRRLLFLIPSLSAGGAERVFSTLLRHLDRSQFELHLALLQGEGPFLREIPADVVIHDLHVRRVRYALPRLIKLIWKLRPGTLLSTLGHLNLALIVTKPLLPPGTRLLIREATMVGIFLQKGVRHPQIWRWFYRNLYKRADGIICPSDAVLKDLLANFPIAAEKVIRIYNPVDVERVRSLANGNESPFCGAGPHLAVVGRLSAEKGLDVLLNAMPAVLHVFPEACLFILGDGPMKMDLMNLCRKLALTQRVNFLGFQDNPWLYMKYANLVVLPSRFEGLPNVMIEALALGANIVATDCSGAMRELLDDGSRITLAPSGDPNGLAEAIIASCKLQAHRPSQTGFLPAAMNRFDLPQVLHSYSKLLLGEPG